MNKFIKAKADLIDSLITKTIIHGSGLYCWTDWDLNTNRGTNRMLRQLRKLPAEFWIHNHPELVSDDFSGPSPRDCYNLLVYLCGQPEYRSIRTDWKIQFFRKD